jgi:hypothetical protein
MTYVILLDGFDTEGWENIQTLFLPSFAEDNVKIFLASEMDRAIEIDDTLDRNMQHTFIFMTVQKARRKEIGTSLIEKYRYKTLLKKIHSEFPYCEHHQNILFVIDRIPKDIGNGLYNDNDKEIAFSLDKDGYLNTVEDHPYFFTLNDILKIKTSIYELIHMSDEITKEQYAEDIENIVIQIVEKKVKAIEDGTPYQTCASLLQLAKKHFIEAFWKLDLTSLERRESLIEMTIKRVFHETVGISESLKHITILTYRPEKINEEDYIAHITIASMISLIANRTQNVLKKDWFEIQKLEVDKEYLLRSLERLSSIKLPEIPQEKEVIKIYNIDHLNHNIEPFTQEHVFRAIDGIPWFYSTKKERVLKMKIEQVWDKMNDELEQMSQSLKLSRKAIYDHPGEKTDKEFSHEEIKEESMKGIETQYINSTHSKKLIEENLLQLAKDKIKGMFSSQFEKLPGFGFYILSLLMLFGCAFLISLIPLEIWTTLSLTVVALIFVLSLLLISLVPLWFYRRKVILFLKDYIHKIEKIQYQAKEWYDERIEEYKYGYETKLRYENRIIFRKSFKKIEEKKQKWKLHNNRVNELNKTAYSIAKYSDISLHREEKTLSLSLIEQDMDFVKEYALFPEKTHINEVVTDITMTNREMESFGIIRGIEIKPVRNGV